MKLKIIPLLIFLSIYLTACGTANTKQADPSGAESNEGEKEWHQYELVMPAADFLQPKNFDEIQQNSSAIVLARTAESLTERKSTVQNDETGHAESFYTDTVIEITDILDQSSDSNLSKGDQVSYREYYALREEDGREYILIYDNYTPLKKGSEYVLVMRKSKENEDLYYNEAWNLGKFNVDGTDPYDFLFDPQRSDSLSSAAYESVNELQQTDRIQKAFSSYSAKKDGNSADSLNQLFEDKMRFYRELKEHYPEKMQEYTS